MPAKDTAASSTPLSGADLWSSSLASHVPFLIARARALMVRRCNQALRPLGLNVRTFSLLWLTTEPVPATQRELSDFLDLDPSQVVALIDNQVDTEEVAAMVAAFRQTRGPFSFVP